jgi:hypothetical protein
MYLYVVIPQISVATPPAAVKSAAVIVTDVVENPRPRIAETPQPSIV